RFLLRFLKDAKLWLSFMIYLSLFRIAFIFYFRNRIQPDSSYSDIVFSLLNGCRFDSMASTCWFGVPFLASILLVFFDADRIADRIRAVTGAAFIIVTTIAWVVTFGYFNEYSDQFNYMLFNLYYDDTAAIFKTIWADYHPLFYLVIIAGTATLAIALQKRFVQWHRILPATLAKRPFTPLSGILTALVILALVGAAARGSVGSRPAQRKDIAVTRDTFLNQSIVNPYFSLLFAVEDHRDAAGNAGLETYLPDGNVRKAAQELFQTGQSYDNLDTYFLRHAHGPKGVPPRHIFLVVMESYDAWPFLKKYASLGITQNLKALAQKGIYFDSFLPASGGTMQSLSSIISGFPYSRVEINYQVTARKPYPSSIAETFKRLGYRTRLFYGGYLSWQRFGDFAHDQGFEETYGAPHMLKPGATPHEWGVDDEYLVDFIVNKVNDDKPSFNLIMTTSYHPPYNVDVRAKGFPLKEVPDDLKPLFDGTTSLTMLGHLWYADKCLGDLVQRIEAKLPRPLFAFTGDHFGRKFINARPDFFERSGVPLILYGKEVLRGIKIPQGAVGAHLDIPPTLIELTAPKGFEYYSMGQDLLAPRKQFLGIGFFRVIGKDFLLDVVESTFCPLPGKELPNKLPDMEELKTTFNRMYGVGWWRVRRGDKL
ncbi:MAG TPA: sulfatase-like hydrolase/transferase, partial [Nitrospirota bacterium]|nr:sulfatase-like hydrolase/transferase [Nitrospirota bacterium]